MANKKPSYTGGIGFFGALTILFIALKLTGHITWPWLLVISPILIIPAIILLLLGCGLTFLFCAAIVKWCAEKKPEEKTGPGDSVSKAHRVFKNVKP